MMRLYDFAKDVGWDIPDCPVFDISNVMDYFMQLSVRDLNEAGMQKIQDAYPPFDSFFMEFGAMGVLWSTRKDKDGWQCDLTIFIGWKKGEHAGLPSTADDSVVSGFSFLNPKTTNEQLIYNYEHVRWLPHCRIRHNCGKLGLTGRDPKTAPASGLTVRLNPAGEIVRTSIQIAEQFTESSATETVYGRFLLPCLYAMMFLSMHSSVVRVTERYPSHGAQRQRKREGKPPLTTYKVIEIRGGEGRIAGSPTKFDGLPYSQHIVRGNMAWYGPKYGRGLYFGKYETHIWRPHHIQGAKDAGVRMNDYQIIVPTRPQ